MNAKNLVLITRPSFDIETSYLHYASGELIKHIEDTHPEYTIINLEGENCTRNQFEKALGKEDLKLVILNGHGTSEHVFGCSKKEVILDKNNINKLDSKIICAFVCESSEKLGTIAIKEGGAEAYIGFEARFMTVIDPTRTTNPEKDKNFKPFVKVYCSLILNLITGNKIKMVMEKTKEQFKYLIRKYGAIAEKDKFGDAPLIRFALTWNLFFLKAEGNLDSNV